MKQDRRLTAQAGMKANDVQVQNEEQQGQEQGQQTADNSTETSSKVLSGYAIVWNTPSKDLGGFTEIVAPNALDDVDLSDVLMLNNHDFTQVLASVKAGTLELEPDDKGLHFKATLPNTSFANDVYEEVKSGNVDACSFGFEVNDGGDTWTKDDNGNVTRTINQVKNLFDVSVVAVPSYDDTNVQVDTRSYEKFMNQGKEEKEMKKVILDKEDKSETRSFEEYIRSRGEFRDGITTQGASAVIPEEVITPIFELKNATYDLAKYCTVKQVSNGQGHYPIATNPQGAILATKEELAEIGDINANMFQDVKFDVKTRAGKIALSNEVIEDSAIDIISEVKAQLQKLVQNTNNKNIIDLINGSSSQFTKATAKNIDDLKKVFNVTLDPALNKTWLVNQNGFNFLDTLKDSEGRYLLQPDVTAPSGFSLLGAPVVVISNTILPDNSDSTSPVLVGDFAQGVAVFERNQVTAQWDKFDSFSEGLSVILRSDYEVIDKNAIVNISLTTTNTSTTESGK